MKKTFDEQLKDAKAEQLQRRIVRDAVFIVLGIFFLILSIFSAQKDKQKEIKKNKTTTISTTIKKTK